LIKVINSNFQKLHQEFVEHLSNKSKSNSTVIAYSKDIEQLLNFVSETLHVTNITDITIEHLNKFKEDLNEKGYTPKSVSRKINSTRTFFLYLLDNRYISTNPAEQLAHPKFETKKPRVLTEMEYRVLRDISRNDIRLYSIVELLLQTGIRISELASLALDDIRSTKDGIRYLYIKAQNTHGARKVPLNNSAYKAIQEYLKIRPEAENDTLFVTRNGNPLLVRNIRTAIDKAFEKAGIENAKVNDLRNTFIAHHLANGINLVTVSKIVGHKRLSTTEKYLGLIESKKKEGIAKNLGNL
jgi:site-specific recombinase XerD